jgi:Secretion system C-terminal sorting domain
MKYLFFSVLLYWSTATAYAQCNIRYTYDSFGNRVQQAFFNTGCRIAPPNTNSTNNTHETTEVDIFPAAILFPNPTSGVFKIEMPTPYPIQTNVSITNALGVKVAEGNLSQPQFDISNQAAGIYFVNIQYQNQTAIYKIIVE